MSNASWTKGKAGRGLALGLIPALSASVACSHLDADQRVSSKQQTSSLGVSEFVPAAAWGGKNQPSDGTPDEETTELFGSLRKGDGTPREAARRYVLSVADDLGISPPDLETRPPGSQGPASVPVLWDPDAQKYRFTRVSFRQARDGIPVFGSRIDVLLRNEADSPVVWVSSSALELGDFRPGFGRARVDAAKIRDFVGKRAARADFRGAMRPVGPTELEELGDAEPVIWAGTRAKPQRPRRAATLIARASGERFRLVIDATTGDVLWAKSLIVFETVSGHIRGNASAGFHAAECEPSTATTMPYARLLAGRKFATADSEGTFSIDSPAGRPLELISSVAGTYFKVEGALGSNEKIFETVSAPATVDVLHNEPENEFALAQVNGYVQANQVRDWLLHYHPDFPVIADQLDFPVNVNQGSFFCPGNAWYDGESINFCRSSDEYANTSFASVNHHEFGHHIVSSAGSGQGAYGEGLSDAIAMLLADNPDLGVGFFRYECDTPLRSAVNDCQYSREACSSCGDDVHGCGQLISGIVWDMRENFAATLGDDSLSYLSNLVVNSTLLHQGERINRRIAVHFLTLDDDDEDIGNGTPHRAEICSAFAAHGIQCPPLDIGLQVRSEARFEFFGHPGAFEPKAIGSTLTNRGPGPLEFSIVSSEPWLVASPATGNLLEGEQVQVQLSIDSDQAGALAQGIYEASVTFVDESKIGEDVSRPASLQVGEPVLQHSFSMDIDPGWSKTGAWQFGVPLGFGGDPEAAATGRNVYGFNLSGRYRANQPERTLTTTALDCSNLSDTQLRYFRWLGVESSAFDQAQVRVSNDGTEWSTVWSNGADDLVDEAWVLQDIDISEVADGQSTVYVKWTLGPTDDSVQYGGWNLDDVQVWGFSN